MNQVPAGISFWVYDSDVMGVNKYFLKGEPYESTCYFQDWQWEAKFAMIDDGKNKFCQQVGKGGGGGYTNNLFHSVDAHANM